MDASLLPLRLSLPFFLEYTLIDTRMTSTNIYVFRTILGNNSPLSFPLLKYITDIPLSGLSEVGNIHNFLFISSTCLIPFTLFRMIRCVVTQGYIAQLK